MRIEVSNASEISIELVRSRGESLGFIDLSFECDADDIIDQLDNSDIISRKGIELIDSFSREEVLKHLGVEENE